MQHKEIIGIIGGEGELPVLARSGVIERGSDPYLFSIAGITPAHLDDLFNVDRKSQLGLFQLGKLVRICKKKGIKKILFIGRIQHKSLYSLKWWKADFNTLRLLLSLSDWRADTVLGSIANYLGKQGILVESSVYYLKDYLAPEGVLSGIQPTKDQWEDIIFGFGIAKELSRVDAGQTVLVKKKVIVALEGMEGTDKCIERAGKLAGSGCVLIKVAKPSQDERFDVPVIGMRTLEKMKLAAVSTVAIEAHKTLVIEPHIYKYAKDNKIAIVAIKTPAILSDFS